MKKIIKDIILEKTLNYFPYSIKKSRHSKIIINKIL